MLKQVTEDHAKSCQSTDRTLTDVSGFDDAELLMLTGYEFPLLVTPKVVNGQSIDGVLEDGNDLLMGGPGDDRLSGEDVDDQLFG